MKNTLLALCAPILALTLVSNSTPAPAPTTPAVHCQVPCGIYGDGLRIEMMMEDLATVEKAMGKLIAFQAEESPNLNQVVRWTMAKDEHAQKIQDQVAGYWLAQRIKLPAADANIEARSKYMGQLALLHQITVYAMKCKQGTDVANVNSLKHAGLTFSKGYFNEKDYEHIESHHKGDHK
jgi:nickel superoxide dismutase